MASKGIIRSIRISDQMAKLIDQQVGSNFTEKWENLVTRCVWELPKKEDELKRIQEQIEKEKLRYYALQGQNDGLRTQLRNINTKMDDLYRAIETTWIRYTM